jgi:hypothetical protein
MTLFEDDPNLDFSFTAVRANADDEGLVLTDWTDTPEGALHRLLLGCCIVTSTVVARRRSLMEVGLFDHSLRLGDDYDLFLRVAESGRRMAYLPEPLTTMGVDVAGISARADQVNASYERVLKRHLDTGLLPPKFRTQRRRYWALRHLNNASYSLEQRRYPDAAAALLRAFSARPASARPGWFSLFGRALLGSASRRRRRPIAKD